MGDNTFLQDYLLFPKTQATIEVKPEGTGTGTGKGGGASLDCIYCIYL